MERVDRLSQLFRLPANVIPHSVIALGYSAETGDTSDKNAYDPACVHWETW